MRRTPPGPYPLLDNNLSALRAGVAVAISWRGYGRFDLDFDEVLSECYLRVREELPKKRKDVPADAWIKRVARDWALHRIIPQLRRLHRSSRRVPGRQHPETYWSCKEVPFSNGNLAKLEETGQIRFRHSPETLAA